MLAEYDVIQPGLVDRIVTMAEQQAETRRHLERVVIEGNNKRASRAQWISGFLFLTALLVSAFLIYKGYSTEGLFVGGGNFAAFLGVFIYGRWDQRKERTDKARL